MMLIGLVMFVGMGLLQWGLPHLSYLLLRRRLPKLGIVRTLPVAFGVAVITWFPLSLIVFTDHGNLRENLIYFGATLCGYLYPLIPLLVLRWLKQNRPSIRVNIRYGIAAGLFAALSIVVWYILHQFTTGSF